MNTTSSLQSQVLFATAKDAKNEQTKKAEPELAKLNDLSFVDNRALYICYAVFPFDLFPDIVTIDRNKITITKKYFFFTRSIQSIMITDLLTIVVEEALLFASLQIVDRLFPQETIEVTHLQKSDARQVRWILEGLIIGKREQIDFTKIPNESLLPKLIEIGKTKTH